MISYVSTGKKILRHLDRLKLFQTTGKIQPISIQIAPTSRCNLNCCFCSNVDRKKHEDLLLEDVCNFNYILQTRGAKSVEWTGGGDPTQYKHIETVIHHAHLIGLKQGFITNGIDLVKNVGNHIQYLDWIRISLNSLDYVSDINIPTDYKGTLGFSYVMNQKTDPLIIDHIKEYVKKYKPKYVRIVPNCQIPSEELNETNLRLSKMVSSWGLPFFYQTKTFSQPKRCWWGYFKPFLLHDGYVYPCSSVVLNSSANRSFHKKFRLMSMQKFLLAVDQKAVPFNSQKCTNCVFGEQNSLIESTINPEMESFL